MKKVIGSILCIAAIGLIIGSLSGPKTSTATSEQKIQNWAAVGVLLTIGIALSASKNSEASDSD